MTQPTCRSATCAPISPRARALSKPWTTCRSLLPAGEVLGLVGESGSGKSVTGFSIIGLVDPPGRITGGSILYQGQDLAKLTERQMRDLRGNRIAMIFQDPMMTLNPVLRIDTQMIETVQAHTSCPAPRPAQKPAMRWAWSASQAPRSA